MTRYDDYKRLVNDDSDDCLIWPYRTNSGGYGYIRVSKRNTAAHVLACEDWHGPRPLKHEAAHLCGVPACFNPRHVRWATKAQNAADRLRHGTDQYGEKSTLAKLTREQVAEIRLLSLTQSQTTIAKQFGISQPNVSRIVRHLTWIDRQVLAASAA